MSNKRDKALSSAETSIELLTNLGHTIKNSNYKVIEESDKEEFSGPFKNPFNNALAKHFPGAFKAKVDKPKPTKRKILTKSTYVSKKKATETEFMKYNSDDSDNPNCPMCASTKYRCEKCRRKCCTPCANYDAEDPDPVRGHGDYKNIHPAIQIANNCR
jgi:hypothetical protein